MTDYDERLAAAKRQGLLANATEHFREMLVDLNQYTDLKGHPSQIAMLIAASLQIIDPDTDDAQDDANALEKIFCIIASDCSLKDGTDTDYEDNSCTICGDEVEATEDDGVCITCKEDHADDRDDDDEPDVEDKWPNQHYDEKEGRQ